MIPPIVYWIVLVVTLTVLVREVISPGKQLTRIILLVAFVVGLCVDLIRSNLELSSSLLDALFTVCFIVVVVCGLLSSLSTNGARE